MKTENNPIQCDEHYQTIRLSEKEMQDPIQVVNDFFNNYDLVQCRKFVWEWFKAVLSSPEFADQEGHIRNGHAYFYEQVEALVEATYLLKVNFQYTKNQA
ncbi:hypothetical protein [Niastella sp. OAS944]|uniref:hypothetical protein n=1 Tax=Niastella sp. OAS944 TaxID=2664089 RepID=UPI003479EABF|nr:hypothetical protein [Chitinophagaceae bacterium OAS944]